MTCTHLKISIPQIITEHHPSHRRTNLFPPLTVIDRVGLESVQFKEVTIDGDETHIMKRFLGSATGQSLLFLWYVARLWSAMVSSS